MAESMTQIRVQVCYALPELQWLRELNLPAGSTLQAAIDASGLLRERPEIDVSRMQVGIHGKLRPLDTVLRERDRVEIYRPLIADPKDARRRRARQRTGR
jgi:putative ubiquitin-RnfH superfamily antitoxin RatB of RatAB toxin-antitoxin module